MTSISVEALREKLDTSGDNLLIIDVREPWEHEEENIGARNIPLPALPDHVQLLDSHKEDEIVVHCKSGKRGHQAMKYLAAHGFKNVKNLEGGIEAYLAEQ